MADRRREREEAWPVALSVFQGESCLFGRTVCGLFIFSCHFSDLRSFTGWRGLSYTSFMGISCARLISRFITQREFNVQHRFDVCLTCRYCTGWMMWWTTKRFSFHGWLEMTSMPSLKKERCNNGSFSSWKLCNIAMRDCICKWPSMYSHTDH